MLGVIWNVAVPASIVCPELLKVLTINEMLPSLLVLFVSMVTLPISIEGAVRLTVLPEVLAVVTLPVKAILVPAVAVILCTLPLPPIAP